MHQALGFVRRYYQREKREVIGLTLTPLFLGDANQGAAWRAEPFKALVRYGWRLARGPENSWEDLLREEARLFGSAGEKEGEGGQSLVRLGIAATAQPDTAALKTGLKIAYPKFQGGVEALLYLGGMGLLDTNCRIKAPRSYFPAGSRFTLSLNYAPGLEEEIKRALAFLQAFGAIGSRCRNGWGSFVCEAGGLSREEVVSFLHRGTRPWVEGFGQDYPTCLGKDEKGLLLWKTKSLRPTWEEAMRDLADAYAGVRARTVGGIGPLDPDGPEHPSERHLLGFPLTRHEAKNHKKWGKDGRHASPLRLIVRKWPEGFGGVVLHVPHRFSEDMTQGLANLQKDTQLAVWKKVHKKLDALLLRARYEDCL